MCSKKTKKAIREGIDLIWQIGVAITSFNFHVFFSVCDWLDEE